MATTSRPAFTPVQRPSGLAAFEFAVLAGLRAVQLSRGCTPRVTCADKNTVTAQLEVAQGKVVRLINGEQRAFIRPTP
jgi:DNA-directed RNA polymerase subunit K/omega